MKEMNREVIRNARRASDDAKRVVMLTPAQFEGLLDLVSDLVKETEMLKTEVENLLDRVKDLEKQNAQVKSEKTYSTSGEEKKYQTADRPKKFTFI